MLPASEETAAVADLRVARDGSDVRFAERLDELAQGAGLEDRVRVDHDDDVVPGLFDPVVQRGGLAQVLLAQDAGSGQVETLDQVARAVGRAVVDDEHLELGVVALVERAHRALDVHGLVEGRDDDGEGRREAFFAWPAADGPGVTTRKREQQEDAGDEEHRDQDKQPGEDRRRPAGDAEGRDQDPPARPIPAADRDLRLVA